MTSKIFLDGHSLSIETATAIAHGANVKLSTNAKNVMNKSRRVVEDLLDEESPIYGVNTGFGALANTTISRQDQKLLQRNILLSHAAGSGAALSAEETRLALALRLNLLIKGFSGTRYALADLILKFLEKGILPVVPEYGSVGASGDLVPLAHLGLPLIGEGKVIYKNGEMSARDALKKARLKPLTLVEKEGLSFVNGTEVMLAIGTLALNRALILLNLSEIVTALSFESLEGRLSPLDPRVHRVRNHKGQQESAQRILKALRGSFLTSSKHKPPRVQDPYSLRCAPQVLGAVRTSLDHVASVVECELNAVTDNPIVFYQDSEIVSGGNFHGEPLAMAFDFGCIACSELGNISERRLELLSNPEFSGLPPFLSPKPGVESGYMALQYLSGSLVNENKVLSHPASTDSIPGNNGIEDFVSMGMTSARKFRKIAENTERILATEMLASCQAIDMKGISKLGAGTKAIYNAVRTVVPPLTEDRIIAEDVAAVLSVIQGLNSI